MMNQILQLRKRYHNTFKRYTKEDFSEYLQEFFRVNTQFDAIMWSQEEHELSEPVVRLTPKFIDANIGVLELLEKGTRILDSTKILFYEERKRQFRDLASSLHLLKDILEAKELFFHLFGKWVDVRVTSNESGAITLEVTEIPLTWGEEDAETRTKDQQSNDSGPSSNPTAGV